MTTQIMNESGPKKSASMIKMVPQYGPIMLTRSEQEMVGAAGGRVICGDADGSLPPLAPKPK